MPAPRVKILDLYGNVVVGAFASGVSTEATNPTRLVDANEASKVSAMPPMVSPHSTRWDCLVPLVRARTFCGLMRY